MIETIIEILVNILFDLILSGLMVLFAWVATKIGTNQKLVNINKAKTEVEDAVLQTVRELQQTVVDNLKAAAADGKLTQDEIAMLGDVLLDKVIIKMSDPCKQVLIAAGVDLEAYILGSAEKWILKFKTE